MAKVNNSEYIYFAHYFYSPLDSPIHVLCCARSERARGVSWDAILSVIATGNLESPNNPRDSFIAISRDFYYYPTTYFTIPL